MIIYATYRSFFLSLTFLLFFCATPSFSSLAESNDGDDLEEEVAIHVGHDHGPGVPCTDKPKNPYCMQNLPPDLGEDPRFNYLKNWGYRYWVLSNFLATAKYMTGIALLGTANAALWDFIGEDTKESLNTATAILVWRITLLKSGEAGATAKAKRYKKEAKAMVAQANLNAGIPIQNLIPLDEADL